MLTKGQIIFAIIFFVTFVIVIGLAYRKDRITNKAFFKGSYKILLFALFIYFVLFGVVKLKHWLMP